MTILSVEDLKSHLNIEGDGDNLLLTGKIAAAEDWVGKFVGSPLDQFDPLPDPLKEAVRQMVGHLYENREASIVAVSAELLPLGLYDLMAPYRTWSF